MKDKTPTPSPTGEPIVLRINLHIHDQSGTRERTPSRTSRARNAGASAPSRPPAQTAGPPPRLEGALDRNRLAKLIAEGSPVAAAPAGEPDIEVTLVVHV